MHRLARSLVAAAIGVTALIAPHASAVYPDYSWCSNVLYTPFVSAGFATDAYGERSLCVTVVTSLSSGPRQVIQVGIDPAAVQQIQVLPGYGDCPTTLLDGAVGDPSSPIFTPYKVGLYRNEEVPAVTLCVRAGAQEVQIQAWVTTSGDLPVTVTTATTSQDVAPQGEKCGSGLVDIFGPQTVNASERCVSTHGAVADCAASATYVSPITYTTDCPPLDEAKAAVESILDTVLDEVYSVYYEVLDAVEPYLTPILEQVDEAYDTVTGTVNDNVNVGNDLGNCTYTVASMTTPTTVIVRTSPPGATPVSLCVTTDSGTNRVTLG